MREVGRADSQSERKAKVRKGQGTAIAKGFVLVLLVGDIVMQRQGNPKHPFPKKEGILEEREKSGKKMLVKKEDKNGCWGKKGCC